jgi:hypothetical protein
MTVAAMEPHTALNRERAGIVVVGAIRPVALTEIINIERRIESKRFTEVNGGQTFREEIE